MLLALILVLLLTVEFFSSESIRRYREASLLNTAFLDHSEATMLKDSLLEIVLKNPFHGSVEYKLDEFKAVVRIEDSSDKPNLNNLSLQELSDILLDTDLPEESIEGILQNFEDLKANNQTIGSLDDVVKYKLIDAYSFWIKPGLYRYFTVYSEESFRIFMAIYYHGRRYVFFIIVGPHNKILFEKKNSLEF
ncbi:hypothetical protein [Thermosulfurimonas sp. F29]|uniref:hypothetical protein n=1 Tax=Thermosulfurimonas sp. F29 TaxID=2867247 RepID=UPI001C83DB84|nr:hypothetical protein [Thermosulfurimonas sp. F29]MBX6424268.1 hypothetical protein [Thermosulfurimonas sp. F29]